MKQQRSSILNKNCLEDKEINLLEISSIKKYNGRFLKTLTAYKMQQLIYEDDQLFK